jgi:hypothetical protein
MKHPDYGGTPPRMRNTAPSTLKFRRSQTELKKARRAFSRLRPGMRTADVTRVKGKPGVTDTNDDDPGHWRTNLLGVCANDHNEKTADIYFTERWAYDIARRGPLRLRDRSLFC